MLKRHAIRCGRVVGIVLALAVLLGAGGCADINIDTSGFRLSNLLGGAAAREDPAPQQMPAPAESPAPVAAADR